MNKKILVDRVSSLSLEQRKLLSELLSTGVPPRKGSAQLVAYVAGKGQPDLAALKKFLSQHLPDYMIPNHIVPLDELPKLPNGKIDTRALPSPRNNNQSIQTKQEKASLTENTLVRIWEEVLGFQPVALDDNFFEIGGDSILSIQIVARARSSGLNFTPNQLFRHQNIRELARVIEQPVDVPEPSMGSVEAIYPLNFLQQRLLIHSLSGKEQDQGFIQVTCTMEGPLDPDLLKQSWRSIIDLHAAFRTSIHWENTEKPVQVVHPKIDFNWQYLDLSDQYPETEELIGRFMESDKKLGFDFSRAPISRWSVMKLKNDKHLLVWSCHHILFDGWSGKVALQQVFECYDTLCGKEQYRPVKIPDYGSYVDWISKLDPGKPKTFWVNYFNGFESPTLLGSINHKVVSGNGFKERSLTISQPAYDSLRSLLRKHRVTVSTFLNATWGVLLGHICNAQDIVIGSTVSGRTIGFPQVEKMVGFFMNVLPVRLKLLPQQTYLEYLQLSQHQQLAASEFEYVSQDSINSWIEWKSNQQLFDTLVVTQNLMTSDIKSDQLNFTDVKGHVTTTHALTIIAEPNENLRMVLRYNSGIVDPSLIEWVARNITTITNLLITREQATLDEFQSALEKPPAALSKELSSLPKPDPNVAAPTNYLELELTKIWEELIGKYPLGIDDDFFNIGGDSFMALQLISRIERIMNRKVSPMALIQHPTIRSMVRSWSNENNPDQLPSLVPIRAGGDKPPLFVIHGGGGHVFFYYPMTKYLDKQQPVYALQPVGLFGEAEKHNSIEEMANHYFKTIKSIQPAGSFSILGTCLSDPVCVEINNKLREHGEAPLALIIVDSSPIHLFPRKKVKPPFDTRIARFKNRFQQSPYRAIKKIFMGRLYKRIKPLKSKWNDLKVRFGPDKQARNLLIMQQHLRKLYTNYRWKKFEGRVTFIKSSQNKNWDEEVWQNLAKNGVKIIEIPGDHYGRFEEPNVAEMSRLIQQELDLVYKP